MPFLRLLQNFLVHFALIALIFEQFIFVSYASAANLPINTDGTTNTQIDSAANGVPIVNIAAPNAGGLSHNKFTDYNVNQQGLILNNSTGTANGVVNTQIGGLITDNANLSRSGAASIILNEVTSNNVTRLNGYTEIAGAKADLIIANPNGISMSGAGFINTARLTAVVGSADQSNAHPNNLTFSLSNNANVASGFLPELTISGAGVDLESVSSTDLVASLMNIVAPIYGGKNEVNLRTGDHQFDYLTKYVTSDNTTPGSNLPTELAIDASNLAKIQAGKIFIVATKEGFGIKYSGDLLASRNGIEIDAQGNIEYKNIESNIDEDNITDNSGNITLTSHQGDINQQDESILLAKSITINSNLNDFTHNDGSSIIADTITLNSNAGIILEENSLISSKNSSDSDLTLNINAINDFDNYGNIISQQDLTINSSNQISNHNSIVANQSVFITAINNIENYAIISAQTDLSLTSTEANITNYTDAEIIGGTGTTTLRTPNGVVTQNSLHSLVSHGDLTLDVEDFVNTGRVDIAGNFTLNVANDLTNEEYALIYSGGNMELNVVNNLTNNTGAVIYSEGDLTIQKYAATNSLYDADNNKINKLDNLSAEITSYAGNMTILAEDLNNKKASKRSQGAEYQTGTGHHSVKHGLHYIYYYRSNVTGVDSQAAEINSGGNLVIETNSFLNDASNVFSKNDMTLNVVGSDFSNNSYNVRTYNKTVHCEDIGCGTSYSYPDGGESYPGLIKSGGDMYGSVAGHINNSTIKSRTSPDVAEKQTPDIVGNIDAATILETGTINTNIEDYFNGPDDNGMFTKSTNPNSPLFETRSEFIDQSKFFGSNYFYEQIGLNLDDVQTEFELQNKRLVGDQFFQTKIIEEQLRTISKTSLLLSSSETDTNSEIKSLLDNAADEYARLGLTTNTTLTQSQIDNLEKDIIWFETKTIDGNLYVVPTIYLTQASKDALANKNIASKSTIFANGSVNIVSNSATNSGSIIGNDVTISATNDITNKNFSDITATNDLSLTSTDGSITNFSQLQATNALSLSAAQDITNTSTVLTNAKNLIDSGNIGYIQSGGSSSDTGNITSTILETAGITAGNVTINAGNDFTNNAANIDTTGALIITAGDDINIGTLELRNRTEKNWGSKSKGGTSITDTTTNVTSNINSGGNLSLTSANDTSITGSDINVDGNATINTTGDLNIVSATDTYYKSVSTHKKGSFSRKSSSSSTESNSTNVMSNINVGGDINSNSQENINIIASNLTSGGDINLEAVSAINIVAGQDTTYKESSSDKKGTTIIKSSNSVAYDLVNVHSNLNAGSDIALTSGTDINLIGTNLEAGNNIEINAGDELMVAAVADESYRYSNSTKTRSMATIAKYSFGISAALKSAEIISDVMSSSFIPVSQNVEGWLNYAKNLAEGDLNSKTSSNVTRTKTYTLSDLKAGNNLNISSNNNVDLIGTNIDATDAIITSNDGDVNIANVKDSNYSKSKVHKSKTTFTSIATDMVRNTLLALSTTLTSAQMLKHPDAKKQTADENTEAMSQKSQKQFTQINSKTDETIVASTIDVANLTINSGRDTVITSSDINTSNDLNINSTNDTIITSDYENDSSFTLTEKKNPNIVAAFSNGLVKLVGDAMPDPTFKKPDKKEKSQTQQRENDSLDHNPHSQDISVATNTDNAMINGYTISNDDADEISYDTNLDKRTTETKTYISSNINSQNDINIDSANGNNTIIAANLAAGNDININALNGETIITSATNESFEASSQVKQDYNDISANYNRGRVSLDAETSVYEKDTKTTNTTQLSSNLTSGNSININTKDDINILSSNLNSNNEINLNSSDGNTNIGANKNTQQSETEIREGTMTLSAGVGHVAVDAAYAVDDIVKAAENLKDAVDNLKEMKKLQKQGKATKDAVDDAETNLAIAHLNVTLAGLKALSAAEKVNTTAVALGFYADLQLTRTGDKTNMTSNASQEVASSLLSQNNININSGSSLISTASNDVGNTNIKGNIQSTDSDINITSFNDTNIEALKSDSSSSSKSEGFTQTVTLGASYGKSVTDELIYALSAQISKRSGSSDSSNTTYTNTNIAANNGAININSTNNDTNIIGANLAANSVVINSGNDLNVASLQNTSKSKSKSKSVGAGGGSNSVSLSYNSNRSSFERNWVDDQTSIIAQNSLTINTTNNTDVKGAVIASNEDNLLINTGTLTFSNIIDTEKQESSGFGISTNISLGVTSQNPDAKNPNQDKSYYPNGSTTLSLQNEGYEKEQITRATIGSGTINITDTANQTQDIADLNRDTEKAQEITKDTITGALNVSATVDNRLIAAAFGNQAAQDSLEKTITDGPKKLIENPLTPIGVSILIENYTGQELSWKPGDVARFKEKGNEFATSVPGALTIGMANVIPTDPSDPKYNPERLKYIGQPITVDQDYYNNQLKWANEGGGVSSTNVIPGFNSMSVMHDKWGENSIIGAPGMLQLSITPAIPINYYGLIGKSIRNLYEDPK